MPLASNAVLEQILEWYRKHYSSEQRLQLDDPQQTDPSLSLSHYLATTKAADLYHRKNFKGHLTASAFILSADARSVLLLHHKSLNRWLQPGGHIDASDASILEAAHREVMEETGISKSSLSLYAVGDTPGVPIDIDSHHIPANPKKNEDAHVHHDFRFLLQLNTDSDVTICAIESNSYKWISIDQLEQVEDHARVAAKIRALTCG